MGKRQIYRLTEAMVRNAKPKEIVEPISKHMVRVGWRGDDSDYALMSSAATAKGRIVERKGERFLVRQQHTILNDGLGLLLQVSAGDDGTIRKSWVYRYSVPEKVTSANGKVRQRQRWLGLGSADVLTLAQARQRAQQLRLTRLDGIDPITEKRGRAAEAAIAAAKAMTFDQAVDAYIADHGAKWSSQRHAQIWRKSLEQWVSPVFGSLPIQSIDKELVIKCLRPLWQQHPETGMRVRGRIESVLAWAAAHGKRSSNEQNPAQWKGNLEFVFPRRNQVAPVRHMTSLPFRDVPGFVADLQKMDSVAARALEFTILTVARTSTVLRAEWSEVDLENRLWLAPAAHMKKRHRQADSKPFRCPLSDAAVALLKSIPRTGDRIFPVGASAMRGICEKIRGQSGIVHGFRSSFSDWANETDAAPREVIEESMAHVFGTAAERAYRRDDLLPRRRVLLDQWAAFCSGLGSGNNVVPMRAGR
jgi:integrase